MQILIEISKRRNRSVSLDGDFDYHILVDLQNQKVNKKPFLLEK